MNIEEKSIKLDEILSDYEAKSGLGHLKKTVSLDNILPEDMELTSLTEEELNIKAIQLAQTNNNIQRCLNKETARVKWAEGLLTKYLMESNLDVQYLKQDEKFAKLALADEYASKLRAIRQEAGIRADRLSYITQRVDKLVDTLIEFSRTKRLKMKTVEREENVRY